MAWGSERVRGEGVHALRDHRRACDFVMGDACARSPASSPCKGTCAPSEGSRQPRHSSPPPPQPQEPRAVRTMRGQGEGKGKLDKGTFLSVALSTSSYVQVHNGGGRGGGIRKKKKKKKRRRAYDGLRRLRRPNACPARELLAAFAASSRRHPPTLVQILVCPMRSSSQHHASPGKKKKKTPSSCSFYFTAASRVSAIMGFWLNGNPAKRTRDVMTLCEPSTPPISPTATFIVQLFSLTRRRDTHLADGLRHNLKTTRTAARILSHPRRQRQPTESRGHAVASHESTLGLVRRHTRHSRRDPT